MKFRIRSILVASDLSPVADEVVQSAASLAKAVGGALHVINAQEPVGLRGDSDVLVTQRRVHNARLELDARLADILPSDFEVATRTVAFDRAHAAILRRAKEVEADLIVIGPHRERPYGDALLGTTADRLVRTANVPCLIVRKPLALPLATVLVPSDLSRAARGALYESLTWAEELGGEMAASVRVVHVDTRPGENPLPVAPKSVEGELLHTHVSAITEEFGTYLTAEVQEEVVVGASPSEEILKVVARMDPSLVVMGTHGDGALIRTLIGSVSSSVARQVEAPVLLVPPNLWKAREGGVLDVDFAGTEALGV